MSIDGHARIAQGIEGWLYYERRPMNGEIEENE